VLLLRPVQEDLGQFFHRQQLFNEDEGLRLEFLFDILVDKDGNLPG
jgi:hypothetical protein